MSAERATTPIADFAQSYSASGTARLHMPGHKGRGPLGCEKLDITEICGADELYCAQGIIAESEANAARLFGTAATYYSCEGSSLAIRAMLFLALRTAPKTESRPLLLAARNAHKALIYAAALLDFDIEWLWPEQGSESDICSCTVTPAALSGALQKLKGQGRAPFGVYATSPDYLGGTQDIAALAAVCGRYAVPLLVDNAHGAYLRFLPEGSRHPIALGAAMCCDSAHKTLPVLTGGAYLHLGPNAPIQNPSEVRGALALFGSTSPSYLILQSLDLCNRELVGEYPQRLRECLEAVSALGAELNAHAVKAGCPLPLVLKGQNREPLKITLDSAAVGLTGGRLAQLLRQNKVECEYAGPRYVVLMPSPYNSAAEFERVREALTEAINQSDKTLPLPESDAEDFAALEAQAEQKCTIRQAMFAAQESVPAARALGRVCALPTVSCPPAVPIAVSGEAVTPAAIKLFERYGVHNISVESGAK